MKILKISTPKIEPSTPPKIKRQPIFKSIFFLLKCAIAPEKEAPRIWLASLATAIAGGIPIKNKRGVIKKPPPTPNIPESIPTIPPNPINKKMLTEISAMGR